MRKPIAILLVLFLSGCNNMYNHFSVRDEGFFGGGSVAPPMMRSSILGHGISVAPFGNIAILAMI